MPHVVIENAGSLKEHVAGFAPLAERTDDGILKIEEIYLGSRGTQALALAVVVEGGPPSKFFIDVLEKESAITVRLFPLTDPEKTPGVRKLMALLADRIRRASPGASWGKTNLQDFLPAES